MKTRIIHLVLVIKIIFIPGVILANEPSNIIFFLIDDQRYDHLSMLSTILPLEKLVVEDEDFSCIFEFMGYEIEFKSIFERNKHNITGTVEGYGFTFVPKRKT